MTTNNECNNQRHPQISSRNTRRTANTANMAIQLVKYSEKSVAVFGETKAIKEKLKFLGGRFNRALVDPANGEKTPGWIFSLKKENVLQVELKIKIHTKTPTSPPPPKTPTSPPPPPKTPTSSPPPPEPQQNSCPFSSPPPPSQPSPQSPPRSTLQENQASQDFTLPRELHRKYQDYVDKKRKVQETGRMSTTRDSSRSRVYHAESRFSHMHPDILDKMTENEVISFFKHVIESETYRELSNNNQPKLYIEDSITSTKLKGAKTAGCATQSYVKFARECGMDKHTILHELSHTCGNAHHDIKFREDHIKLVKAFLGNKYATTLKKCYSLYKLKSKVPEKIMTPEEWFASYQKIIKMQEKTKK